MNCVYRVSRHRETEAGDDTEQFIVHALKSLSMICSQCKASLTPSPAHALG